MSLAGLLRSSTPVALALCTALGLACSPPEGAEAPPDGDPGAGAADPGTGAADPGGAPGDPGGPVVGPEAPGGPTAGLQPGGAPGAPGGEGEPEGVPVAYDRCPDQELAIEVPIVVNDTGNAVVRAPGLTSFLVPFARSAEVRSLNRLAVFDAEGQRLPAQLEVLSRWGSHPDHCETPVRFAYAHVRAAPPPGVATTWTVRQLPGPLTEASPLRVEEDEARWVIDTGSARFTVPRDRFAGLARVELADPGGFSTVSELAEDASSFHLERAGSKSTGLGAHWRLELERSGPQVVTVVARGFYGSGRDLAYTVRMHFVAGSASVRIEHTYYYGEVAGWGAEGLTNTTRVERAFMRVPLVEAPTGLAVRAAEVVHTFAPEERVRLEQEKRTPDAPAVRFLVRAGAREVERGTWASRPFFAVETASGHVTATVARMAEREPQGVRFDPDARALEIDFTSSPIQIGGARGIWSVAALDFRAGAASPQAADALQLHAERPLLGVPAVEHLNGTDTLGPYVAGAPGPAAPYFDLVADIHQRTRQYLLEQRITGLQIWPDLPRSSCVAEGTCNGSQLFEGGDNNYWNWSKVGLDEFFRTGDNRLIYDFSLGEAVTYVETLAVRTDHDRLERSSVTGLAPCYGNTRGYAGDYREGLNNRRDRCPADYSYDKSLKLAYLATGDGRFVDFFEESGVAATQAFGNPSDRPSPWLELNLFRLAEQRLENLANGAEFAKDEATSAMLLGRLREYSDFMLGRVLIDGHACNVGGSGINDVKISGSCRAIEGWMMPVPLEWVIRTARLLDHQGLRDWVLQHGRRSMENHTVMGPSGPDYARRNATSASNAENGWRTVYRCEANASGIVAGSCRKQTGGENGYHFYPNGLMAYLNVFGLVLAAEPSDPLALCRWLPAMYMQHLATLPGASLNGRIWGKELGQAFAMSGEALGAMARCR